MVNARTTLTIVINAIHHASVAIPMPSISCSLLKAEEETLKGPEKLQACLQGLKFIAKTELCQMFYISSFQRHKQSLDERNAKLSIGYNNELTTYLTSDDLAPCRLQVNYLD